MPMMWTLPGTENSSSEYMRLRPTPRLSASMSMNSSPKTLPRLPLFISSMMK